ncbi:GNAT family N-acetyltransferase [Albidovulum sp.]
MPPTAAGERGARDRVTIAPADPLSPDLALLMARHRDAMHADTPPQSIHMMEAAALAAPGIRFFAMHDGARAVGMGALKPLDATHAEIKSMHVLAEMRGAGLARRMLDFLEAEARRAGYRRLSLETGSQPAFGAARRLYERAGFEICAPFGDYREDPNSVFMSKRIG